jgi:hypothetical protein
MSRLQVMFNPETIALIGATEKDGTAGDYLKNKNLITITGRGL